MNVSFSNKYYNNIYLLHGCIYKYLRYLFLIPEVLNNIIILLIDIYSTYNELNLDILTHLTSTFK